MKICPECGSEWAPKFKFCPEDGTPLPSEAPQAKAAVPATSPSKRPKAAPATGRRLLDIEPAAPAAAPAPAPRSTRPPQPQSASVDRPEPVKPQRLVKDAASRTSARVQGARGEAPRDDGRATSVHEVVSRTGPTAMLDAVQPPEPAPKLKRLRPAEPPRDPIEVDMTSETRRAPRPEADHAVAAARAARAAARAQPVEEPPARAPKKAEPKPEKKPAKKQRDFSETAWFMRQPNPEDADPATGKVKVGKKAYAVEEPIPDEKRKKYSLRRDDD